MKNQESARRVGAVLAKGFASRVNQLKPCEKTTLACPCHAPDGSKKGKVDLVLLIDGSSSMSRVAKSVNSAAEKSLAQAIEACGAEVRHTWLWVDSTKPGSGSTHNLGANAGNFSQSHQVYLQSIGVTGPFFHDFPDSAASYNLEQGADAIADISQYFDWREGACRSIFYVSDTALEGVGSTLASNDLAKDQAIRVANASRVSVFAHKVGTSTGGTSGMNIHDIFADYVELCQATGGYADVGGGASVERYENLITKAVCECGGCQVVESPEVKPCISIAWGDGDCDSMETDDFEVLGIKVANCYSNIAFHNFKIGSITISDAEGKPLPQLPDGTLPVQAIPFGPICFGDVLPCKENEVTCVFREFAIYTRGAKPGKYQIKVEDTSFEVKYPYQMETCFSLELCRS